MKIGDILIKHKENSGVPLRTIVRVTEIKPHNIFTGMILRCSNQNLVGKPSFFEECNFERYTGTLDEEFKIGEKYIKVKMNSENGGYPLGTIVEMVKDCLSDNTYFGSKVIYCENSKHMGVESFSDKPLYQLYSGDVRVEQENGNLLHLKVGDLITIKSNPYGVIYMVHELKINLVTAMCVKHSGGSGVYLGRIRELTYDQILSATELELTTKIKENV